MKNVLCYNLSKKIEDVSQASSNESTEWEDFDTKDIITDGFCG